MKRDLLGRLADIAALLTGHAEELAPDLVAYLRLRYERHDWLPHHDLIVIRERLPARWRWLLEEPEELDGAE